MNQKLFVGTQLQLRPTAVRLKRRPRIEDFDYVGEYAYHLTLATSNRRSFFGSLVPNPDLYVDDVEGCTKKLRFHLLAYCFMPDHLHLLIKGQDVSSNLLQFVQQLKQKTGYRFKQDTGLQLWQQSLFDRVLRRDESIEDVAEYIFANPVQAGMVGSAESYAYSGGILFAPGVSSDGAEASSLRGSCANEPTSNMRPSYEQPT